MKQKVQELKVDLEAKNNTMAENDMLHLDLMERVRNKYGYCSDDEESKYESDEEKRNNNRYLFRLNKAEELRKDLKCDVCRFTTKSEVGLRSHKTKKHVKKLKEKMCPWILLLFNVLLEIIGCVLCLVHFCQ